MTKEELEEYGYKAMDCMIGKIYFSGPFGCRFIDGDSVDVRLVKNDMVSLGIVKTINELMGIELEFYEKKRKALDIELQLYEVIVDGYKKKLNKKE